MNNNQTVLNSNLVGAIAGIVTYLVCEPILRGFIKPYAHTHRSKRLHVRMKKQTVRVFRKSSGGIEWMIL